MDFKFNVNNYVKVKLTEYGISILEQQHKELNEAIKSRGGKGIGEFKIDIDEEGYTKFQMWKFMNHFGYVTGWGNELPFETEIIITNGETIV